MARGNLPLGERFELFGRAGISYDYLTYDDNTVTVTSVELKSSTFEGLGLGLGFGAAMFLCPERDYSIAFVANLSRFDQVSLLRELVDLIHGVERR